MYCERRNATDSGLRGCRQAIGAAMLSTTYPQMLKGSGSAGFAGKNASSTDCASPHRSSCAGPFIDRRASRLDKRVAVYIISTVGQPD